MRPDNPIPYCGTAPVPGHVVWNTDPWLWALLLAMAALYGLGTAKQSGVPPRRQLCFWSGWAVLTLALTSPLCNLSVALFSARIAQHVLLTTVAAPLLVLGQAEHMFAAVPPALRAAGRRTLSRIGAAAGGQVAPVIVFTVVLWAWHLPALYDATFRSTAVYWAMHATMIGAALLFWRAAFRGSESFAAVLLALFATMLQMSLLGALLTFARRHLFAAHAATTWTWGLSPLQDQELGGLIMWVVGGMLLALYALFVMGQYLARPAPAAPGREGIV